jgi:hypothetical protein
MDESLAARVAALEEHNATLVLAGNDEDGWGAWRNLIEIRLSQERTFSRDVFIRVIAELRDKILREGLHAPPSSARGRARAQSPIRSR